MRILNYVPQGLKQYVKLLRVRQRYSNCIIESHLIADGASLGTNCTIARDVELGTLVSIGDNSYVNVGTVIASGTIGKYCSIGYSCQIGMPEHPLHYLSTSPRTYGPKNIFGAPPYWDDYASPPLIENDVWIGSHALVLQGVHVGNGAIVAGGAVVTKDVRPYAIVAGVPAKEIHRRFDDSTIDRLLTLRWWDLSMGELTQLRGLFELKEQAAYSILEHTS